MYTPFGTNDIVTRQAQELVTSTWTGNVNNLQTALQESGRNSENIILKQGDIYDILQTENLTPEQMQLNNKDPEMLRDEKL